MGRLTEAETEMRTIIPQVLNFNEPHAVIAVAEDYGAILAGLGDSRKAVELLAAADATRARLGIARPPSQERELAEPIAKARLGLTEADWAAASAVASTTPVETVLADVYASRAAT